MFTFKRELSGNCLLGKKILYSITFIYPRRQRSTLGGGERGNDNFCASVYRMINDLRLRMETSYRRGECASVVHSTSRRGGDYALSRNTRAALTRALKIYHLARGAFHIVPRYACRIASSNEPRPALNAQRSKGSDGLQQGSFHIRVT